MDGFRTLYGEYPVTFRNCWFESNGDHGIYGSNCDIHLHEVYFEKNGDDDVFLEGHSWYNCIFSSYGSRYATNSTHYSLNLPDVKNVNLIGNKFRAYNSTCSRIINVSDDTKGVMIGND